MAVEADLGLVVQLHVTGVQRTAQIAQQAEPVGGVAVALGLVHLHARAVPLRLVHRDVRPPQQSFRVQCVLGEDGDARARLQDEGEPVEIERRGQLGDQMAGDALGAGGGVGRREQYGELVAAEPGRLGAPGQGEPQPVGYLEQQPVPREMAECVIDGSKAVEIDQYESRTGTAALRVREGGPGPLQEPLTVRQTRQGVAQLLLRPGPGDPQRGVEGDQRYGEQGQQKRQGDGDDTDQRGDAEQGDRDKALPKQGRTGRGGQTAPWGARTYHNSSRVTTR